MTFYNSNMLNGWYNASFYNM